MDWVTQNIFKLISLVCIFFMWLPEKFKLYLWLVIVAHIMILLASATIEQLTNFQPRKIHF